ncbi:arginine--tRNA ligase [Candidatus Micrarchaeota archaeon CG08_land_8_20_14_0_20_59_11]|nr:MAG: arginine--tRNA ligase [Candidatus Micrarchaeota archaeon CG08_land_8_20_14_0_20_59_11]
MDALHRCIPSGNAASKAISEAEAALEKAGAKEARVTKAREGFGDLAFPCFALAKEKGKTPQDVAEELAKKIKLPRFFSEAQAQAGFVNFVFSDAFYEEALSGIAAGFGKGTSRKGDVICIDYSSPNVGKPLHIGHIRSTVLGDAIKRLLEFQGAAVVGSNYLCDAGKQTAMLMTALKHFGAKDIKTENDLLEYYVRIHKEIENSPELVEEARRTLEKMENGEKDVAALLKKVRTISVAPIHAAYKRLGVSFDEELYDSDLVDDAKKMASEAVGKDVAKKEAEGETVVILEPALPNFVVLRSNGTTLYSTRDLALADYRFKKHHFKESVYVTASEQNLHFKQVFETLRRMGRAYSLKHIGFGLIFLQGMKKLSTREGKVLLLDEVLDECVAAARKEVEGREHAANAAKTAEEIGLGSLKFAVLRVTPEKNIVFDPKAVTAFEGFTGAYVQYTVVRTNGIMGKAGKMTAVAPKNAKFDEHERAIISALASFPQVCEESARNMQPHVLCDYLLTVASKFSAFYANCPVLQADGKEREKRLAIVRATKTVLEQGLSLLGIKAPEKM